MEAGETYEVEFITDSHDGTDKLDIGSDTGGPPWNTYITHPVGSAPSYGGGYNDIGVVGLGDDESGPTYAYDITGLTPDTTYYYRAVAKNIQGRTNGSQQTFKTSNSVIVNTTTSVSTTSVQANGYIFDGDATAGFWVHTESNIDSTHFTKNQSAQTENDGKTIYATITGLDEGEYYYIKAWQNDNGFRNSTTTGYFLTKPASPTSVSSEINPSNITLTWSQGAHEVTNYSTVIRYSTSDYPSAISGGDSGVNVTGTTHTFEGLSYNQNYFFSLWSYVNASGSPTYHAYSPSKTTHSGATVGGTHNITIRYENTSHGTVNLNHGYFHECIIHFTNTTQYVYFDDVGEIDIANTTTTILSNDTGHGTFEIAAPAAISEIEFYWNYSHDTDFGEQYTSDSMTITDPTANNDIVLSYQPSDEDSIEVAYINESDFGDYIYTVSEDNWTLFPGTKTIRAHDDNFPQEANKLRVTYKFLPITPYRCHRIVIPDNQTQTNIYIFDDKKIYGETTDAGETIQNTLVPYNYYFVDQTGDFSTAEDEAYVVIFIQDASGNDRVIHSEYLLTGGLLKAQPQLMYNKKYYMVIYSGDSYAQMGEAPTSIEISPQLFIQQSDQVATGGTNPTYSYYDIITDSYDRNNNFIRYNYTDTISNTDNVSFILYYANNRTQVTSSIEYAEASNYQYQFFVAEGYNITASYYLIVEVDIRPDPLGDYAEYNGTYFAIIPFYNNTNYSVTSASWIDTLFNNLFGDSPLYRTDKGYTQYYVPWSYIFLFVIAFITMLTFSRRNGFIAMIATGLVVTLLSVLIAGLEVLYSGYVGYAVYTAVIGGLMAGLGVIGILGGIDTR